MSPQEFWTRLAAARSRLRRSAAASVALAALLAVPALMVVAWLAVPMTAWDRPSPLPLAASLVALGAGAALATVGVRRWLAPLDEATVAGAAEAARGLPEGSLRGALELRGGTPVGTSPSLARLSERALVERVGRATPSELAGSLGERASRRLRRLGAGVLTLALAVAALGASDSSRARAAWAPLLRPLRALAPPDLPPLEVSPGHARVARGDTLAVTISAPERRVVSLHWRAQGELPGRARLAVDGGGAAGVIGPVEAPTRYWVNAPDGAVSDTFVAEPLDPLLLSSLTVDVAYPAYLGRPADRFQGEPPPLVLPEGATLRLRGTATRPLGSAALRGPGGESPLAVDGDRFDGRLRPAQSGTFGWALVDAAGEASPAPPPPLQIALVPDSAPWVQVRFPGEDTEVGPDMRQPIVAHAGDDHGLRRAALVSWRVDAFGQRDSAVRAPIQLGGVPATAALHSVLEATGRRLLPGGRLEYFVEVTDDGPRAQTARSATFALRFPSADELRHRVGEEADDLLSGADDLSRTARELERATRELQRRMQAGENRESGRSGGGRDADEGDRKSTLEFERAEDARSVLDQQEALLEEAQALREQMEKLSDLSESAGLSDPEFQERLDEIRDLLDEVGSDELREQLNRLREALENLDAAQTEQALQALAEQQQELQQRLEQSLELLRRAAAEQEMRALADDARRLAAQQEALAQSLADEQRDPADATPADSAGARAAPDAARPREGADRDAAEAGAPRDAGARPAGEAGADEGAPRAPAQRQADLAEQAGDLSERLGGLQERLNELGEATASERSGDAGDEAREGGEAMREAARRAGEGQRQEAADAGRRGARSMEQAADLLDSAREAMTEAWRDDTAQALEQATQDALSLAEREAELLEQMQQAREDGNGASEQQMADMRGEQAAVQEGLESIARNLSEASSRSAMVDRQVGEALGEAMQNVQQSASAMEGGDGRPRLPIQETQAAVDAMNNLALSLLQNAQQVGQSSAGTGLEQALRQLAEAASQQGRVNNEASALSPEDLSAAVLSRQARRLSERQQDIARQLQGAGETLGGQEETLGDVEAMAEEAERLARELAGGRLDRDVLARQERLFHRMLDAGRSLEREELGDERTAEAAAAFERLGAGALDPALTAGGVRYPTPPAALLQKVSPGYRRLILDYFDLINRPDRAARPRSPDTDPDDAPATERSRR